MELWKKIKIPIDKAKQILLPTIGEHEAEERGEGGGGKLQSLKALPWKKILVCLLIAVGAIGFTVTAATILSNILTGTTTITGISISPKTAPLIPSDVALNTLVTNNITVNNPTGAALDNAKFVFNFTAPAGFTWATDDIEVWVDLDRDGTIESGEKLSGAVHGNILQFVSPTVTIPTGTSSWKIQVRFVETELVGKSVSWKVYVAS